MVSLKSLLFNIMLDYALYIQPLEIQTIILKSAKPEPEIKTGRRRIETLRYAQGDNLFVDHSN
jgi:hypothetical protein